MAVPREKFDSTNQKHYPDMKSDALTAYGISALVSQTLFGGQTCGSVAKCRLFSQVIEFPANSNRFSFPFRVPVTEVLLYVSSHLNWIPKIMVQFCYLRLYLGIENVSRRLLLCMEKMDTDWTPAKIIKILLWLVLTYEIWLISFS